MTSIWQEHEAAAREAALAWQEAARTELEARQTRDLATLRRKEIEAAYALKDWTGSNQKQRDAQMDLALATDETWQAVTESIRGADHDMREADYQMRAASMAYNIATAGMEHETGKMRDMSVFGRFDGAQGVSPVVPAESANA